VRKVLRFERLSRRRTCAIGVGKWLQECCGKRRAHHKPSVCLKASLRSDWQLSHFY